MPIWTSFVKKRRYDTLSYNEFENIQIQCCNEDLSDFKILKKEKYDKIKKALKLISEKERKIIKERTHTKKLPRLKNTYFQFIKAYQGWSTMDLRNKNYVKCHH